MLKINTNLSSLIVQSNLQTSTLGLNQAIERMTTGFKINGAKDNAANFSISTKLSSKLSSYNIAQENVLMGLDMLTTAEDNLSVISNHLTRIRALTEQAANGTYGESSLNAIQSEITARLAECNRVVYNTEYNGIKFFAEDVSASSTGGKFVELITPLTKEEAIKQGYIIIETADELQAMNDNLNGKYILMSDIDLAGYDWETIGNTSAAFNGEFNGNGFAIRNLTINNPTGYNQGLFGLTGDRSIIKNVGLEDVDVSGFREVGGLVGTASGTIIENCYVTGTIAANNMNVGGFAGALSNGGSITNSFAMVDITKASLGQAGGFVGIAANGNISNCFSAGSVVTNTYSTGGFVGKSEKSNFTDCYTTSKVVAKYHSYGAFAGVVYASSTIANCKYYSSVNSGMPIIGDNQDHIDLSVFTDGGNAPTEDALWKQLYSPAFSSMYYNPITFQVGINSDISSQITLDVNFGYGLSVNVSSSNAARSSLDRIDKMLAKVRAKQSEYGAAYNRLESALETIGVSIDNLTSTRSTIRDADIAEESSEYIKMQILQQASATLLATANQTPAIALQLL